MVIDLKGVGMSLVHIGSEPGLGLLERIQGLEEKSVQRSPRYGIAVRERLLFFNQNGWASTAVFMIREWLL